MMTQWFNEQNYTYAWFKKKLHYVLLHGILDYRSYGIYIYIYVITKIEVFKAHIFGCMRVYGPHSCLTKGTQIPWKHIL